jgi:hypothetical protein
VEIHITIIFLMELVEVVEGIMAVVEEAQMAAMVLAVEEDRLLQMVFLSFQDKQ